jgi:hypothetical protein
MEIKSKPFFQLLEIENSDHAYRALRAFSEILKYEEILYRNFRLISSSLMLEGNMPILLDFIFPVSFLIMSPFIVFLVCLFFKKSWPRFLVNKIFCYLSGTVAHRDPFAAVVLDAKYGPPMIWSYPGIMVRSMPEKLIAEYLARCNIKFDYEAPIDTGLGYSYFPDFTLHIGGETFFFEHFGLLSDPNYADKSKRKISWFEENYPGRLLVSTAPYSLLLPSVRGIVKEFKRRQSAPETLNTKRNTSKNLSVNLPSTVNTKPILTRKKENAKSQDEFSKQGATSI